MSITEALRGVPLFSGLSKAELHRLSLTVTERSFGKGEVVFFESDPGNTLYVVLSGRLRAVIVAEDGREVMLALLRAGEVFGEMALLDHAPRSAQVITLEPSRLLLLGRGDFQRCLLEMPSLMEGLLRQMAHRLREADDKIRALTLLTVRGRVADALLSMADTGDGLRIDHPVSHSVLAQLVGSTRESVQRTIQEFHQTGLVQASRRSILLRDRSALQAAAGRPLGA